MPVGEGFVLIAAVAVAAVAGASVLGHIPPNRWRCRVAAQAALAYGTALSLALAFVLVLVHIHGLVPPYLHPHVDGGPFAHLHEAILDIHMHDPATAMAEVTGLTVAIAAAAAGLLAPLSAFATSQASLRALLRQLQGRAAPAASRTVTTMAGIRRTAILVVRDPGADAYCFSLLSFRLRSPRPVVRNYIVLTSGLADALPPDQLMAVVAHEAGHLRALDARYLPFFRILRRLVFFDPLFRRFVRRVEDGQEVEADRWAAEFTGQPLALAKALVATHEIALARRHAPAAHLHGSGALLEERVRRLVEMHRRLVQSLRDPAPAHRGARGRHHPPRVTPPPGA